MFIFIHTLCIYMFFHSIDQVGVWNLFFQFGHQRSCSRPCIQRGRSSAIWSRKQLHSASLSIRMNLEFRLVMSGVHFELLYKARMPYLLILYHEKLFPCTVSINCYKNWFPFLNNIFSVTETTASIRCRT